MIRKGIVFYDLEWTANELLQIGAVCEENVFDKTILTKSEIHPKVTAKTYLQTRIGRNYTRCVYDLQNDKFLEAITLKEALQQFIDWLKLMKASQKEIILVSLGKADIPVIFQSFSRMNKDLDFLNTVTHFLDLQDYFKEHFPGLPVGLEILVQRYCSDKVYRFHSAVEDARATKDVFFELHSRGQLFSSTQLVAVSKDNTPTAFAPILKVRLNSMSFEMGDKELNFLSNKINPDSTSKLHQSVDVWIDILSTLPLFQIVDPPPCFMFMVGGWVVSQDVCQEGSYNMSTVNLLCFIGNSYWKIIFRPDTKSTFKRAKLCVAKPYSPFIISRGTPVIAKLQLKQNKAARVMYLLESDGISRSFEEAMAKVNATDEKFDAC